MNAVRYDSWYDSPLGAACLEAEIALLRRGAGELKGKSVLEVGCGTGRFLQVFGREAVRAVGLDRDPEMLDFAQRRRPLEVADYFEWVQGDAAVLPFPEASFDLVFESTLLIRNVLRWRSLTEQVGARLWPWVGAYYAVCGVKDG